MTVLPIIYVSLGICLAMLFAWQIQQRTRHGGWTDLVWYAALAGAGLIYALLPGYDLPLTTLRQQMVAVLIGVWALRQLPHLFWLAARLPEDARYGWFRRSWGPGYDARLLGLLQVRALAAALLALSMLLAARNPAPLRPVDMVAFCILVFATGGAAVADMQARQFAADPANSGGFCTRGLWALSRHPDYFFECLAWVAFPILAIDLRGGNDSGYFALTGPVVMYWLLTQLFGIPQLEAYMEETGGAPWQAYRARTRAFLPVPR